MESDSFWRPARVNRVPFYLKDLSVILFLLLKMSVLLVTLLIVPYIRQVTL